LQTILWREKGSREGGPYERVDGGSRRGGFLIFKDGGIPLKLTDLKTSVVEEAWSRGVGVDISKKIELVLGKRGAVGRGQRGSGIC